MEGTVGEEERCLKRRERRGREDDGGGGCSVDEREEGRRGDVDEGVCAGGVGGGVSGR